MTTRPRGGVFRYDGFELDARARHLECRYSLGDRRFVEHITLAPGPTDGDRPPDGRPLDARSIDAARAAARLVYLLAGVSYYKTAAPPVIDLGGLGTTDAERAFLRQFYVEGLGEFAYRNGLDLGALEVTGGDADAPVPVAWPSPEGPPLVPFGGGIDSIVTADALVRHDPRAALFVLSRQGDRFAAIERPAELTGMPVVRAERAIDPAVLASSTNGFLNGHVPVTGILSAIAVLAAVRRHNGVVMSNERSASVGNLEHGGRVVNHQWSKGLGFETGFRALLDESFSPAPAYYSYLRPRSELWVAERFSHLRRFHDAFRSCNRAFAIDPARRLDQWCATCDKCCFIDLVLAPYLEADELRAVFGGREPLDDAELLPVFRTLIGAGEGPKPWECVGDEEECRVAASLAAARPDRNGSPVLARLADLVAMAPDKARARAARLLRPEGAHYVPSELGVTELGVTELVEGALPEGQVGTVGTPR